MILGLLYVCGYIALQDATSEHGYFAGLGLGAAGILGFAVGLLMSIANQTFLVPDGLILMGMSLIYFAVAVGCCVDWPFVVLARRVMAAYFLSPFAYLVFIGQVIFGWFLFRFFLDNLPRDDAARGRRHVRADRHPLRPQHHPRLPAGHVLRAGVDDAPPERS